MAGNSVQSPKSKVQSHSDDAATLDIGLETLDSAWSIADLLDATVDEARAAALAERGVQSSLEGKTIVKVVYVPGRVLNIVVK